MTIELYSSFIGSIWIGALTIAGLFVLGALVAKIVIKIMDN